MSECPNLPECCLTLNKKEYNRRCLTNKHLSCGIYLDYLEGAKHYPRDWKGVDVK